MAAGQLASESTSAYIYIAIRHDVHATGFEVHQKKAKRKYCTFWVAKRRLDFDPA
jgi:hypothetical protein